VIGLYHTEHDVRLNTVRQNRIDEWSTGPFVELSSRWLPWFRTVFGLRTDAYAFDVSGTHTSAAIVSPKASLVFTPSKTTELYLNGGLGFHSNDARIAIVPGTAPLVRSRGAEVGARVSPIAQWTSAVAVWTLDLDSELLYNGDDGTNSPSSPSHRLGVTWSNVYRPLPQLAFDADASFVHARFADHTFIPGALESTFVGGMTWTPHPSGFFAALHVRRFGSYPLAPSSNFRAPASTQVNADAGYRLASGISVRFTLLNVFNALGDDIDYLYASRLPGEQAGGVVDQHLHPVEPRQLRVSLAWGL
jgi:outer membrane receptor protein involved in Fe transport